MAQIIVRDYGHQTIKESTEELFELLQDDKQFIFVDIKHTFSVGRELDFKPDRIEYVKTAINKTQIIQAF